MKEGGFFLNKRKSLLLGLLVFLLASSVLSFQKLKPQELSERYRKWLEEEVVYIITPVEKEVFLQLQTDRERDLFIEAFWRHRDPTPSTPENEFKNEHYRRINYANHFFGRGIPKPGWKTDRGRVYIILGEPNDVTRFEGKTQVYPTEVWFYQGKTNLGLPPGFYVVFFQEGGTGEYRLYSPLQDGPMALLTSYYGDPIDYMAAYEQLREFEPELAEVSLNLIPGERAVVAGRPTMSSDVLLQQIEMAPVKTVEEKYARKFLEYKDIVEVEYSTNYIDCDSVVKAFQTPSGLSFIHYAIEPEQLSVNQYQNKYYTTLKLNGTVSNMKGQQVYQFEKNIHLEFSQQQMSEISRRPLSIRDMFPLIPGEFKLSLLLKNEISKEFTSVEKTIFIPPLGQQVQLSPLLLAYDAQAKTDPQGRLRPFFLQGKRLYFQGNRVFLQSDTLYLGFQVGGLTPQFQEQGEIEIRFIKENQVVKTQKLKPSPLRGSLQDFILAFPLQDFVPAHYVVEVALLSQGQEMVSVADEFDITYSSGIPRPWVYSKLLPGLDDQIYNYVIGTQYLNNGQAQQAKSHLLQAYQSSPGNLEYAFGLAQAHWNLGEIDQIPTLLAPFLKQPNLTYEILDLLGKSWQKLEKWAQAVEVYDQAVERFGTNPHLLNALGDCYFALDRKEEARVVWEKSLQLNPHQPEIEKKLKALKER